MSRNWRCSFLLGRKEVACRPSLSTVGSWKQAGWGACETVGLGGLMRHTWGLGSATLRVATTHGAGLGKDARQNRIKGSLRLRKVGKGGMTLHNITSLKLRLQPRGQAALKHRRDGTPQ